MEDIENDNIVQLWIKDIPYIFTENKRYYFIDCLGYSSSGYVLNPLTYSGGNMYIFDFSNTEECMKVKNYFMIAPSNMIVSNNVRINGEPSEARHEGMHEGSVQRVSTSHIYIIRHNKVITEKLLLPRQVANRGQYNYSWMPKIVSIRNERSESRSERNERSEYNLVDFANRNPANRRNVMQHHKDAMSGKYSFKYVEGTNFDIAYLAAEIAEGKRILKFNPNANVMYKLPSHKSPKNELSYFTKRRTTPGCHWGQRKLLFSEIDFLSLVFKKEDPIKCLVLYIGAASGAHQVVNHELFPTATFLFYDPAPFDKLLYDKPYFILKTGDNGFFGDDKIPEVKQIMKDLGKEKLLFISDIRLTTDENMIWNDMKNQARWMINLDSDYYMMKFRPPYTTGPAVQGHDTLHFIKYENNLENIDPDKLVVSPPPPEGGNKYILYLGGTVYYQLYAPYASTETRLIGGKDAEGKYNFVYYNYQQYENQLNYFNTYVREEKTSVGESYLLPNYLLGYRINFDSMREYQIIYNYLDTEGSPTEGSKVTEGSPTKGSPPSLNQIVKLLYKINLDEMIIHKRTLIFCYIDTMMAQFNEEFISHAKRADEFAKNIFKKRITLFLNEISQLPIAIKQQIFNMYEAVKHHPILSYSEIDHQIDMLIKYKSKWVKQITIDKDANVSIQYTTNFENMINKFQNYKEL